MQFLILSVVVMVILVVSGYFIWDAHQRRKKEAENQQLKRIESVFRGRKIFVAVSMHDGKKTHAESALIRQLNFVGAVVMSLSEVSRKQLLAGTFVIPEGALALQAFYSERITVDSAIRCSIDVRVLNHQDRILACNHYGYGSYHKMILVVLSGLADCILLGDL